MSDNLYHDVRDALDDMPYVNVVFVGTKPFPQNTRLYGWRLY